MVMAFLKNSKSMSDGRPKTGAGLIDDASADGRGHTESYWYL